MPLSDRKARRHPRARWMLLTGNWIGNHPGPARGTPRHRPDPLRSRDRAVPERAVAGCAVALDVAQMGGPLPAAARLPDVSGLHHDPAHARRAVPPAPPRGHGRRRRPRPARAGRPPLPHAVPPPSRPSRRDWLSHAKRPDAARAAPRAGRLLCWRGELPRAGQKALGLARFRTVRAYGPRFRFEPVLVIAAHGTVQGSRGACWRETGHSAANSVGNSGTCYTARHHGPENRVPHRRPENSVQTRACPETRALGCRFPLSCPPPSLPFPLLPPGSQPGVYSVNRSAPAPFRYRACAHGPPDPFAKRHENPVRRGCGFRRAPRHARRHSLVGPRHEQRRIAPV